MALINPDFDKFWPTRSKIITFYHTPSTHLFVRVLGSYDQKGLLVYRYYIIYWPYLYDVEMRMVTNFFLQILLFPIFIFNIYTSLTMVFPMVGQNFNISCQVKIEIQISQFFVMLTRHFHVTL